jgi:hypothetical protein
MPTADDNTFPDFGVGGLTTSPLHRFDAAELTSYTGTTADLRDAVWQVVRATYCEFNVQVLQTTTAPPTTFARRNTIGVGTDSAAGTFGLAEAVDTNDATAVDSARVWAGTYQTSYGGTGGALTGANSTLQRWAFSIGGTAAHEAGHNYGISHADGLVLATGEDVVQHHIMASGSNYSGEDRAGYRRHFSNREYSLLAANVGLAIQTMWNWDLVNPNAQTGFRLRMDFLSTRPSIILSWSYSGNLSPWINPAVTGPSGTQVFKGTTYNRYRIEWSSGQAWSGGSAGQVPAGASFHVGATFSSVSFSVPDAIIITNVQLLDNGGTPLAQSPRLVAFDSGVADAARDSLDIRLFNVTRRPLIIRDLVVRELPRVMSLDAMVPGGRMVDLRGQAFQPWPESTRVLVKQSRALRPGETLRVSVARLSQRPHVRFGVNDRTCGNSDRLRGPDVRRCRPGVSMDLFPATTLFLTATIVDPSARFWDPRRKGYVQGELRSRIFYQIAGRRRAQRR